MNSAAIVTRTRSYYHTDGMILSRDIVYLLLHLYAAGMPRNELSQDGREEEEGKGGGGGGGPCRPVAWNTEGQVTEHRQHACLRLCVIGNQLSGKISARAQPDIRSGDRMR